MMNTKIANRLGMKLVTFTNSVRLTSREQMDSGNEYTVEIWMEQPEMFTTKWKAEVRIERDLNVKYVEGGPTNGYLHFSETRTEKEIDDLRRKFSYVRTWKGDDFTNEDEIIKKLMNIIQKQTARLEEK
jgi:sugar phosphate isomerase/epimerase